MPSAIIVFSDGTILSAGSGFDGGDLSDIEMRFYFGFVLTKLTLMIFWLVTTSETFPTQYSLSPHKWTRPLVQSILRDVPISLTSWQKLPLTVTNKIVVSMKTSKSKINNSNFSSVCYDKPQKSRSIFLFAVVWTEKKPDLYMFSWWARTYSFPN